MPDRAARLYLPPFRIDVTVREGVPLLVPLARLARAIRAAALAAGAPRPAAVGLLLTDDAEIARLNRRYLGHRGPTDVLSFPLLPADGFALPAGARVLLGDIAVSVARAVAQAREGRGGQDGRASWEARDELLLLVVHGTLHLCGRDHAVPADREAMQALERRLLALLSGRGSTRAGATRVVLRGDRKGAP